MFLLEEGAPGEAILFCSLDAGQSGVRGAWDVLCVEEHSDVVEFCSLVFHYRGSISGSNGVVRGKFAFARIFPFVDHNATPRRSEDAYSLGFSVEMFDGGEHTIYEVYVFSHILGNVDFHVSVDGHPGRFSFFYRFHASVNEVIVWIGVDVAGEVDKGDAFREFYLQGEIIQLRSSLPRTSHNDRSRIASIQLAQFLDSWGAGPCFTISTESSDESFRGYGEA